MQKIDIDFDGYCPESLLKGKRVAMRLNQDDFWESLETGLQMTVFPPFAAILRWRGKGHFRRSEEPDPGILTGLIVTQSKEEQAEEIFPDEEKIIHNNLELQSYLNEIYHTREEYLSEKFNSNDPVFGVQKAYLNNLKRTDFQKLFKLFDLLRDTGYNSKFLDTGTFSKFHKEIYKIKIIFSFDWGKWSSGRKNINNPNYDFYDSSLLELSMFLTAIFRADRCNEGTIEANFRDGTLDKIFQALKNKILKL